MNAKLKSVAEELKNDLALSPDLRAQQLIDLDETIHESMIRFEETMNSDLGDEWRTLKDKIDTLRGYAQVAKMRLLFGDDELRAKLVAMHQDAGVDCDEAKAAIDVERDAHRTKGIADVFKALLMWKDSPEERMK
ncbi:MAG: hypothetical protein ABGY95_07950 [Rubritalea sp.]|uniref:hypothetical protein n=1 Tax=Rubritalea sp. TaxID=2109375 RepID=UPI003242FD77